MKKTHAYVIVGSIPLTANDNEYELKDALTADPLAILTIINSDNVPLERVSVEEIHEYRRGTPATGTNFYKYAINGANLFMLYPTPTATDALTVYYVPTPTEMSSASHDPSDVTYGNIPVEYHDLIEYWACYRMAMYDDDQSSGVGSVYKQLFDQGIAMARADIRRRGGRKLGRARLSYRRRIPFDPSVTGFYG